MTREPLMLSGLQHFAFCRRQWALIHIEQQWADNLRTTEGNVMHRRAHDDHQTEARGDTLIVRGLRVSSDRLDISGICDVVEFYRDPDGIALYGREGLWRPFPIEYKKGEPKEHDADKIQLCAQAMCLEEMLACHIESGALFYGETHRREEAVFTQEMRAKVEDLISEMHGYFDRGYTPSASPTKACNACSLKDLCLPKLKKAARVKEYLRSRLKEEAQCENS